MRKLVELGKTIWPFLLALLIMNGLSIFAGIVIMFGVSINAGRQGITDISIVTQQCLEVIQKPSVMYGLNALVYITFLIVFGIWFSKSIKKSESSGMQTWKRLTPKSMFALGAMGVALQILLSYLLEVGLSFFPNYYAKYTALMEMIGVGRGIVPVILTVIFAPIVEEIIFRYFVLRRAETWLPFWAANGLQALCFGVYHQNLVQGIYAFLIGLVFAYVYKRSGTLLSSILLHAFINLAGNVLAYFTDGIELETTIFVLFMAGGVLLLGMGVLLFRKETAKASPDY